MIIHKFIEAIERLRKRVPKGLVAILEDPPGLSPDQALQNCSKWYLALSPESKAMVRYVAARARDHMLFNFLCLCDGAGSTAFDGEEIEVEIDLVHNGQRVRLNPKSSTPPLHELIDWADEAL